MEQNKIIIEKPEWKWYYFIPFTRGRKDYLKDRKRFDNQFLLESQKILNNQVKMIDGISVLLIAIITTLWTLLPPLTTLPNWLNWTKMGMEGFGSNNWGNQLMLTLIPSASGTFIHKMPKFFPHRNVKIILNFIIKFIPVLILVIIPYLPITFKTWKYWRNIEKENIKLSSITKTSVKNETSQ